MASFRARVFLLTLGMVTLICVQVYRTHFLATPLFFYSQQGQIDTISNKELVVKRQSIIKSQFKRSEIFKPNENFQNVQKPTEKSKDTSSMEESQISSERSSDRGNSNVEEYSPQSVQTSHRKSNDSSSQRSSQVVRNFTYSLNLKDGGRETDYLHLPDSSNLKGDVHDRSRSDTQRSEVEDGPGSDETRSATSSSSLSWLGAGELGPDYKLYNISWRHVTPVTDNITLDISRYMNGRPVHTAPVLAHNPSLCRDVGGAGGDLFLLVIIPSLPRHHEIRAVIRETWASPAYNGGFWAGRYINGKDLQHF
ncbi:hypothetical protein ElyMa_005516700 [Elysia marginata]|uniref:Hexosyltransferase n=1 Tax=Elysia marginata TaxID=1093978 RepID=A0AAV4EWP1_9GAST|nr:hypothetical protein ElyMa_005516700 [Elysia marginata]